jgi:hypothetical protein
MKEIEEYGERLCRFDGVWAEYYVYEEIRGRHDWRYECHFEYLKRKWLSYEKNNMRDREVHQYK